jgi:hypothetical protein
MCSRLKLRYAFWSAAALCRFGIPVTLTFATPALAHDLYVSLTGSDQNPGSQQTPFRTIQKAADSIAADDVVHVAPGFYEENVTVKRSGKPDAPIIFKGSTGARNKGFAINASYVTIDGFDVGYDPVSKHDAAIRVFPTAKSISIINNHIHHLTNIYGIKLDDHGVRPEDGPANCIISNNFLEYIGYINVNLNGSNHVVINNAFANSFGEGDAIRAWGANHRVVGNVITNMGLGSRENYRGHPDLMQTFGDWGVSAYNIVFERNYCADSLSQICQLEQKGVRDIRDWTFRNNVFVRMSYAANCDLPGIWWYNNLFYQCTTNTGSVILFAAPTNKKGAAWRSGARNNIFLECGSRSENPQFGWYDAPPGLNDLDCDFNYVAGPRFTPKQSTRGHSTWFFAEPHGINGGNPGFLSALFRDFRLQPDSLLRGRGQEQRTFNNDFFGSPRPAKWSIGPCE